MRSIAVADVQSRPDAGGTKVRLAAPVELHMHHPHLSFFFLQGRPIPLYANMYSLGLAGQAANSGSIKPAARGGRGGATQPRGGAVASRGAGAGKAVREVFHYDVIIESVPVTGDDGK